MKPIKEFYMKRPCADCPMTKNSAEGWLGGERMKAILSQKSFVCHKTLTDDMSDRRQCAGHMHLRKKDNDFFLTALRLGFTIVLKGRQLVFDTEKECIDHHKY